MEMTPETIEEVTDLIRIGTSVFLKLPDMLYIDLSQDVLRLRIYVSEKRPEAKALTPEEREELDQQA